MKPSPPHGTGAHAVESGRPPSSGEDDVLSIVASALADQDSGVTRVSTAVDPLEIAAWLESTGMSNRVVQDRFGHPDVFSLADELYGRVPFVAASGAIPLVPRPGGPRDLARGAMFAAPCLMLAVAVRGLPLHLAWWALPMALICGWSMSQAMVSTIYAVRGQGRPDTEATVLASALTLTLVAATGLGLTAMTVLGGGPVAVISVTCVAGYMVGASVLTLFEEERWLAAALAPGAAAAIAFPWRGELGLPGRAVGAAVVATVIVTLLAASRHLRGHSWHRPSLAAASWGTVLHYLLYGACCGLFVSLVVQPATQIHGSGSGAVVASLPLLLSLGVMEWQVRSFRARVFESAHATSRFESFTRQAWRAFLRSAVIYGLWELGATVSVLVLALVRYPGFPMALLLAQAVLGIAFFVGLVVNSCYGISQVLRCCSNGSSPAGPTRPQRRPPPPSR